MTNIGNTIRGLRKQQGMTQDDLAAALHVTRQTVSNYETGKSEPDLTMLAELAQALKTDVATLLNAVPPLETPAKHRQGTLPRAVLATLLTVGLWLLLSKLEALSTQYARWHYDFSFTWVLIAVGYPLLGLAVGVTLYQAVQLLAEPYPPSPRLRYVHWALLGLLAIHYLCWLPHILWAVKAFSEILPLAAPPIRYTTACPDWNWLCQQFMYFAAHHPTMIRLLTGLLGFLLCMTRPEKKCKRSDTVPAH